MIYACVNTGAFVVSLLGVYASITLNEIAILIYSIVSIFSEIITIIVELFNLLKF